MKAAAIKFKSKPQKPVRKVTILGSTGSIGKSTVNIISRYPEAFSVEALTANTNVTLLAEQAKKLSAKMAVIADENLYNDLKQNLSGTGIEVAAGSEAIEDAAERNSDFVMAAIIGSAGLKPTLKAIGKGTIIGMANKECLVCAGELINKAVEKNGASLIPVDSEHNSIFQIFDRKKSGEIEKITLTASGGPFLNHSLESLGSITPEEAVKHPNWSMGAKISVDSATMMNKGLEFIEAYHLFPVKSSQIEILIHPESVIHGMISYKDGSVIAGMSFPDMQIPISYALGWPERLENGCKKLNLAEIGRLTFQAPDEKRFPAIKLARQALEAGGTAPAILNAANEETVINFLNGKIKFSDITEIVKECLEQLRSVSISSIEDVIDADNKARIKARELIKIKS